VAVTQPGAGEGDAGGQYDNDIGVVMGGSAARTVGGVPRAVGTMAGSAAEPTVIIAMLAGNVREGTAVWTPCGGSCAVT